MQEEVWRWPHPSWTNSLGAGIVPGEALGAGPAPAQDATCEESPGQSTPTWETLGATGGRDHVLACCGHMLATHHS